MYMYTIIVTGSLVEPNPHCDPCISSEGLGLQDWDVPHNARMNISIIIISNKLSSKVILRNII